MRPTPATRRLKSPSLVLALLAGAGCGSYPPAKTPIAAQLAPPGDDAVADLPVDKESLEDLGERDAGTEGVTNLLSLEQISGAVRSGPSPTLDVDLTGVKELLDLTRVDPAGIYGTVYSGPYPFESRESLFTYKRFRLQSSIKAGKAAIDIETLFEPRYNSEGWTDEGQLALRLELFLEQPKADRFLGVYDTRVRFRKTADGIVKLPSLLEGPLVNLVHSDSPGEAVISFVTDVPVDVRVVVNRVVNGRRSAATFAGGEKKLRHEIAVTGLEAGAIYDYHIEGPDLKSRSYELTAAPAKGSGSVTFAFFGDTRRGYGGGLQSHMGVNALTVERLSSIAYFQGAQFLLVGGDLVDGYTTVPADFTAQLRAWKEAISGFWHENPVYSAMGNHEALTRVFEDRTERGVTVDRWPYATESAEALFAEIFTHPTNGPEPTDARRPIYKENVYSFHYGPVKLIAFNNNYWVSYAAEKYGGAPEGYLLEDQLEWIVQELDAAEADPTVRFVILFAQEPIFPNGGHVQDGMWHDGDNRVRAHVFRNGDVLPEEDGMLVVRNRFVRAVARSRKVAAVLGSDEHAYHRILIDKDVPVGDIDKDDRNKNGRIDIKVGETCSVLPDLRHPTWYIIGGGGGAPYYAEEDTPWNLHWRQRQPPRGARSGYRYSSQENVVIFRAGDERITVEVYNPYGQLIDEIEDLMAAKSSRE